MIPIRNLDETKRLPRYPKPTEITYGKGSEYIGHKFKKSLTEIEYRITAKPSNSVNTTSSEILERVQQVL